MCWPGSSIWSTPRERHVAEAVVIGGGIAGLAAAYDLHRAGWSVTVHEKSGRWGGKIHTSQVGDRQVDAGPDSMLARVDAARVLCEELGLADELIHPVAKIPALLFVDGSLHELPAKTVLGVPTDLNELSGVVSAAGLEAANADLVEPWHPLADGHDVSVGKVCRERLGDEITERLIDPLLGGINASHIDHLSLTTAAPQLANALAAEGSLIKGLSSLRSRMGATLGSGRPAPVFYGLPGGIARIIERLVEELAGADLRLNSHVRTLTQVAADGPKPDAIIIAAPAFAAAELVAAAVPDLSAELAAIEYASVAQVTLEVPRHAFDEVLDTSGILFPRVGGTLLTACTWFSSKWAHYQRPDAVLLRLTSGRYRDDRGQSLTDDELTEVLLGELRSALPVKSEPMARRVQRWPSSLPQYQPGHGARVQRIRAGAVEAGRGVGSGCRVEFVGAPYDGIGIPACISSGRRAAEAVMHS